MTEQEILAAQPELLELAEKQLTLGEIVRHFFPEFNDRECDFVIWEKTGYPCFFAPRPGQNARNAFIEQVYQARVLRDRGEISCDCCGTAIQGEFKEGKCCEGCSH